MKRLAKVADVHGFSLHVPVRELSPEDLDKILYGTGTRTYKVDLGSGRSYEATYEGVIPNLERRHRYDTCAHA